MGLRREYAPPWFEQARPHLEALLRQLGFSPEDAMDAAQEAIIEAALLGDAVVELRDRLVWLRTVAVRKAHTLRRRKRLQPLEEDIAIPSPVERWIERESVRSAVERLPATLRDVVVYRYLEEHTHAQAMDRFNLSDGALRRRLEDARQRLADWLENLQNSRAV